MKKYRGQCYSQSQQPIPIVPSKKTLCYRGCKYNPYEPVAIDRLQTSDFEMSAIFLKYRRVIYAIVHYHFPSKPNKTLVRH